jgi:hypothetical protein
VDCNIRTVTDPKFSNISKEFPDVKRDRYVSLMKKFVDIFAWSYDNLKTFDNDIIQHKIPLKVGSNPCRKKIRQFNPILMSIIEKEVKRMFDSKIIVPLRYSDWVANLVPVKKKSG